MENRIQPGDSPKKQCTFIVVFLLHGTIIQYKRREKAAIPNH